MHKNVTLKEVAEAAGVSTMAVSAVLNHTSKTRVSAVKRALIEKVGARLGYRPNLAARTLGGNPSKLIGVYVDSMAPQSHFRILTEMEHELAEQGYRVMISFAHDDNQNIIDSYLNLQQYGADGMIFLSHDYPEMPPEVAAQLKSFPQTIFVGQGLLAPEYCVDYSLANGVTQLFEHLLANGRRRLGLVSVRGTQWALRSRREEFERLGQAYADQVEFYGVFHPKSNQDAAGMAELIDSAVIAHRLDGLIMENDTMAMVMMRELAKRGFEIPRDIAVAGGDNENFGPWLTPALTTLDMQSDVIAHHVVQLLLDMIAGEVPSPFVPPVIHPRLIIRQST